jgi:hypothetical protein
VKVAKADLHLAMFGRKLIYKEENFYDFCPNYVPEFGLIICINDSVQSEEIKITSSMEENILIV